MVNLETYECRRPTASKSVASKPRHLSGTAWFSETLVASPARDGGEWTVRYKGGSSLVVSISGLDIAAFELMDRHPVLTITMENGQGVGTTEDSFDLSETWKVAGSKFAIGGRYELEDEDNIPGSLADTLKGRVDRSKGMLTFTLNSNPGTRFAVYESNFSADTAGQVKNRKIRDFTSLDVCLGEVNVHCVGFAGMLAGQVAQSIARRGRGDDAEELLVGSVSAAGSLQLKHE